MRRMSRLKAFTDSTAALASCLKSPPDLIISDYRMPSMDGVQFLSAMMELQPAVPRMICSGYADRDAIIAAVNEVQLARFIGKPWVDEELASAVVTLLQPGGARARAQRHAGVQ